MSISLFTLRTDTTTFWIVDAFPSDAERQEHLEGAIASSLLANAERLLDGPPEILPAEVLAAKLPQKGSAARRPVCSWHPSRTGQERLRPQRRDRSGFEEALVCLILGWSAGPRGVVTSPVAAHAVLGDFHRCLLPVLNLTALPMGRKPGEMSPFVPPAVNT